jgi:hypothetical protein
VYVADHVKECAVFLGAMNDRGEFVPHGTGFFVGMVAFNYGIFYIVTAKHVLDQIGGDVTARINTKDGGCTFVTFPKDEWYAHPDHREGGRKQNYIDVVACHVNIAWTNWDFVYISEEDFCTKEIIQKYTIDTGDEIVITGMFFSHLGQQRNIPVVRIGNIAAMPEEPVATSYGLMEAYLVEARSIGGISGSPVFTHMEIRPHTTITTPPGRKSLERSEKPHYLLGLVHGHYTINTQEEWISKTSQQVGDMNAGIAIVIPAERIMETVSQAALFGHQKEHARIMREHTTARSGARPDSIPPRRAQAGPPSSGETRAQLEDFTHPADAVARKRPQSDQT